MQREGTGTGYCSAFSLQFTVMSSVSSVLCAISLAVAPIYLVLTATALASISLPLLRDLASHGKTRLSTVRRRRGKSPYLESVLRRAIQYAVEGDAVLVSKRRFVHFYLVGIVSTTALRAHCNGQQFTSLYDVVPTILLLAHLARRIYECMFIHSWGDGRMHIGGYILGVLHYTLIGFVFVETICGDQDSCLPTDSEPPAVLGMFFGAALCLYGQVEQNFHHRILAKLRNSGSVRETSSGYRIPRGRWFELVSCPHYFAEILVYAAFAIMLHIREYLCRRQWFGLDSNESYAAGIRRYQHLVLFVWVAVNLTISAHKCHQWYVEQFSRYPPHRRALIPSLRRVGAD